MIKSHLCNLHNLSKEEQIENGFDPTECKK
jgi:hypothetical protein